MTVENTQYVGGLDETNPTPLDKILRGQEHLELIKQTLVNTFPNITSEVEWSSDEINQFMFFQDFTDTEWILENGIYVADGRENESYPQNLTVDKEGMLLKQPPLPPIGSILVTLMPVVDLNNLSRTPDFGGVDMFTRCDGKLLDITSELFRITAMQRVPNLLFAQDVADNPGGPDIPAEHLPRQLKNEGDLGNREESKTAHYNLVYNALKEDTHALEGEDPGHKGNTAHAHNFTDPQGSSNAARYQTRHDSTKGEPTTWDYWTYAGLKSNRAGFSLSEFAEDVIPLVEHTHTVSPVDTGVTRPNTMLMNFLIRIN